MSTTPVCFLSYAHPTEVDERVARRAKALGCDGIFLRSAGSLFEDHDDLKAAAKTCDTAGTRLVARVDIRRFPLDSPFCAERPDDFIVRRQGGTGPVDPRRPAPATGEALARLGDPDVAERLIDTITERLQALVEIGCDGLCLADAERLPATIAETIAQRVGSAQVMLAGEASAPRPIAGLDYNVLRQLPQEGASAVPTGEVPTLFMTAEAGHEAADQQARLKLAVLMSAGVIVPGEQDDEAIRAALALAPMPPGGAIHQASAASADMFVALRTERADLRHADEALVVVANLSDRQREFPAIGELSQLAAPFLHSSTQAPLAPHEVRTFDARREKPVVQRTKVKSRVSADAPRLVVESVSPAVEGGEFAVKRVVGDIVEVEATIFADGHEQLAAELHWRATDAKAWDAVRMEQLANDRWRASFPLERLGRHEFLVEGWLDRFAGFQRDFAKKVDADVAQPVDHMEGRALVEEAAGRAKGKVATALKKHLKALDGAKDEAQVPILLSPDLRAAMDAADDRPHRLQSDRVIIDAERIEARFSSWYELFPRSMTDDKARHGTFADVVEHLPRIRDMGFDTLYFPPIHPIGRKNRKGPNNTLTPGRDDPGSPYAIGSAEGGHDAIHPELGTFEDFDRLVAAASEHGLEIALDFAIQAAPDHPWLAEHPGWFAWRPDGSMKYAENPPKKYQDIVNVDFYGPDAVPGLWEALRDVILVWIKHGVKTFRVDNPHTKPLPFWEWMIGDVRARHPDAIFLSEAFTRPTMMYRLAKVGFSQSYTYFTWRDTKHELTEYITELTSGPPREFYRPHFFVNTPDINPGFLQTGGRPAHRIRAALAATLSGLWGVYSGFELCDATPLGPGKEEYLDSEKYEIRPREWRAPGDIVDDITLLNRLRRTHPALQTHLNTRFYLAHNDSVIWYGKPSFAADGSLRDMVMVMVNMDPHNTQGCHFEVPLWEFGLDDNASVAVEDLVWGHRFDWHGKMQYISLAPDEPYRIWRLTRPGGAA